MYPPTVSWQDILRSHGCAGSAVCPFSTGFSTNHDSPMTTARTTKQQSSVVLEIDRILQILPQRFPFVLVDRVTEVVPYEHIRGHKCVTMNEPWFLGHYPQRPIMPGVLVLEALSQIGSLLVYA